MGRRSQLKLLLGNSWDLVTLYNWAYNPTYNLTNSGLIWDIIMRVISPVTSSY